MRSISLTFLLALLFLGGCASTPKNQQASTPVAADEAIATSAGSAVDTEQSSLQRRDKFEGYNRAVFAFNMQIDRWFLKPIARGYKWIAPKPVEVGVSNFFNNLGEISNVVNDVLQWKWRQAGNDTGRLLINSTIGVAGLFDVARHTGLERSAGEDFGQTMASWGVPQGPYLILPFLGPSTVTSLAGMPVDWYTNPVNYLDDQTVQWSLSGLNLVQVRAGLLQAEEMASGDFYVFVRDAYLQRRDFLINDGAVVDDFGGDFGGEEEGFDF